MLARRTVRFAVVALLLGGCGTAPQPSTQSAASPHAAEAPRGDVSSALTSEPPLPGEDTSGWSGLAPRAGRGTAPAHQHHAGMNMGGAPMPNVGAPISDGGMPMPDGGSALADAASSSTAVDGSRPAPPRSAPQRSAPQEHAPASPHGGHVHAH